MDKPERHVVLRQDTCVFGLSIKCLLSILHVSLMYPSCVFFQYCMCLWLVHYVSHPHTACVWFVHHVSCLNTTCLSGLSISGLVPIMPASLVCPLCILYQYCLCLWFVHQRHMQYWKKTHDGYIRDTCNIERRHLMDKPKTHATLRQDT
jgi:hypothetical protein